jgi:periplasmic divalent cation tolerance protein
LTEISKGVLGNETIRQLRAQSLANRQPAGVGVGRSDQFVATRPGLEAPGGAAPEPPPCRRGGKTISFKTGIKKYPMEAIYLQVTTTTDSRAEAERLGRVMVERRLAACAQIVGPISSTYWWKGSMETAEEWMAVMKTTEEQSAQLIAAIKAEHSYETPDIVAVSIVDGLPDYLNWISQETRKEARTA